MKQSLADTVSLEHLAGGALSLTARIPVPVPADELWAKLTDYESMPSFMRSLKSSRRVGLASEDGTARVEQVARISMLRFMSMDFRTLYSAKTSASPSRRTLQLSSLESNLFRQHQLEYSVLAGGSAEQCNLEYSCLHHLKTLPPGPFKKGAYAAIAKAISEELATLSSIVAREHQAKHTKGASKQSLLESAGAKVQLAAEQARVLVCDACLTVGNKVAKLEL